MGGSCRPSDDAPRRSHVRQASLVRAAHARRAPRARRRAACARHRSRRGRAAGARQRRHRRSAGHDQGARLARGDGGRPRRLSVGRGRADTRAVSYIDETLLADEHVVYRTALHWIIFARGIAVLIVGIAVLIAFPQLRLGFLAVLPPRAPTPLPPSTTTTPRELCAPNTPTL